MYNDSSKRSLRKTLRNNLPKGEVLLWKELQSRKLGVKFRRQYSVGPYILDFYAPEIRLCVEVDGYTHQGKKFEQDKKRDIFLYSNDIAVLRFTSEQVFDTMESVVSTIRLHINN